MKLSAPFILLIFLGASLFFQGCTQEDVITSNPADKLRFSTDTLSFDTVFSTLGTTTAWLKIYNPNSHKIRISNITLKSGGTKGYHLNVDGSSDYPFTDVDIPAKDSMYLFVSLTAVEQDVNGPNVVEDAILFETNGNQQQIVLRAYSQNAVIWHGKTITADTTLTADKPFLVYDSLVVSENVTLTVSEGVGLYFHNGANVQVYGTVKINGTQTSPVTFRGDRLDDELADFPYDNYPGQWGGINLKKTSFNNDWNYVHIRGASTGVTADSSSTDQSKLKLSNSVIHNMTYDCLKSCNCKLTVTNCQLSNSGSYTVYIVGGQADFVFCTIANYQQLVSRDGGSALMLVNRLIDSNNHETTYPLNASFINTIVFGTQNNEFGLDLSKDSLISGNVYFGYCLLKLSSALSSKYASNCLYPADPYFLKLGTEAENYLYDFRIDSISPARNAADPGYSRLYPTDMNGITRVGGNPSDIGAYQWSSGQ